MKAVTTMKTTRSYWIALLAASQLIVPLASHAGTSAAPAPVVTQPASVEKGPPLPLQTIDGVGGILITPTAYLVNTSERLTSFAGMPSFSFTYVGLNSQNIEAIGANETLFQRLELGYSGSRFGLGSFNNAVYRAAGIHLSRSDVYVDNYSARILALPENSFGTSYLPAITAGAQIKSSTGVETINRELGGALTSIGYRRDNSVDYTLTATKALKYPWTLDRPLLLSLGVRLSEAAWLGYVGYGDHYKATIEANFAYSITDWLWLAGEFRQNQYPYSHSITVNGYELVRPESDWWTLGAAFVLSKHATVTVGYGYFGGILNSDVKAGWAAQLKYEF